MGTHHKRRWLDEFLKRGGRVKRARPAGIRPRLEALEDRSLPSAGPLDPTFGAGGTVQTNLPAGSDIHFVRSALQPDGKIVAAGTVSGLYGMDHPLDTNLGTYGGADFALKRFNPDGSLDPSFGAGGEVHTPLLANANRMIGLALQSDGKILEVGSANSDFIVVRYNPDGGMDGSFGTGGYVLTPVGGTADAHAVAVQADGKIVVAGGVVYGAAGGSDFALARYNPDGNLDATFGQGGEVVTPFPSDGQDMAWDVALQADGKIVTAGQVYVPPTPPATFSAKVAGLVRYNPDGSLDLGFGDGGRVVTTLETGDALGSLSPGLGFFVGRPASLALQADGEIVVGANSSGDVARYTAGGTIDASFGNGGVLAVTNNTDNSPAAVQAVAIDGAGRLLVGGSADVRWFVARYTSGGAPDGTFGSGGQVTTLFAPGQEVTQVTDIALGADGGVTAVGVERLDGAGGFESTVSALARYDANGVPVAGFGANGQELATFQGPSEDYAAGVVVQPDDKVVVAMLHWTTASPNYAGNELELVRYNAGGALDPTFGIGGTVRTAIGPLAAVSAPVLQPDGKILVLANSIPYSPNGPPLPTESRLFRFKSDGTPDTSFGGNGFIALDFVGYAMTVDANGRILVTGAKSGKYQINDVVARLKPDGSPDTTFGGTGEATTDEASAIAVQPDGKIVVAGGVGFSPFPGVPSVEIGVARYNADGSLDTTFGSGGKVTTALGAGPGGSDRRSDRFPDSAADAVALEPDGRIVVGGSANNGIAADFILVRYNPNGSLDGTFGTGGFAFSPDLGIANGVAVQPDGTVLAVAATGDSLAVVSYEPNGRRDAAFAALGPYTGAGGVSVGPDGKVVAAGYFGTGARNTVVARFLNQAPPAPVFAVGTDGSLLAENYISAGWATLSPAGTILSVSAVTDAAGISDVFAVAASGNNLWERTAMGWVDLSVGSFEQISAATDAAGNAVVFGVLGSGASHYAGSLWEYHNGGWSELAGYGLAASNNGPGSVQYVSAVHTAQGEVAYAIESGSNALFMYTTPGGWREVSTGSFTQVSAGLNGAGQAVVFGVVSDGSLWEQNPAFGPIGRNTGWQALSGAGPTPAKFLSVTAGGPDKAFTVAEDHTLWEHTLSGLVELSTGSFADISARRTASGADEVFGALTDGSFWEYSNGGGAGPTWQELLPGGVASIAAP